MLAHRSTTARSLLLVLSLAACDPSATPSAPDAPEPPPTDVGPAGPAAEGYQTAGELRRGFTFGRGGVPIEVTYEVQGGLAVWEGDIVIGRAGEVPRTEAELLARVGPDRAPAIDGDGFRWPDATIPYEIAGDLPNQSRVTGAIDLVQRMTAGLNLVPRDGEDEFVRFILPDDDVCMSAVGMQEDGQNILVGSSCTTGNTAHEILHAAGLFHEQSRCDRDTFVDIVFDNIIEEKKPNFDKLCDDVTDYDVYDEGSMMHYGPFAFAIDDTQPTIVSKRGLDGLMGQRSRLGDTDVSTIHSLYGVDDASPTATIAPLDAASYAEGDEVEFDASGSSDPDDADLTFAWDFGDGPCLSVLCDAPSPTHRYGDNGTYDATVDVSDGFLTDQATVTVNVFNVAPAVSIPANLITNEGFVFGIEGSFTDPGRDDTWSATVDYGEGDGVEALPFHASFLTFELGHGYVDNGSYTTTVEVTDDDGGVGSAGMDVTVNNVAPTVDAGADAEVVSGESFELTGTFTDPGIEDDPWAWEIDWGFGPNATGNTDDQTAPIEPTNQVCLAGTFDVVLSVTDKDGGTGSDGLTLTVPYLEVGIVIMPGSEPNPANLRGRGELPVAILGSETFDATQVDPATVTLGDEAGVDTPASARTNGTYRTSTEDVNDDGHLDLVLTFARADLRDNGDLTESTTDLVLRGLQVDGCTNFRGSGAVVVVP